MFSLSASPVSSSATQIVRSEVKFSWPIKQIRHAPLGLRLHNVADPTSGRRKQTSRVKSASIICACALNARCSGAEQTQTITRQSSTITIAPEKGKEKSPDLDDGGAGFPPRDDGDGGGGGGGEGGWSGGFFLFGFLCLLGLLRDNEEEGPYDGRRR